LGISGLKEAKRIGFKTKPIYTQFMPNLCYERFDMNKLHEIKPDASFNRIRSLLDRYSDFVAQAGKSVRRMSPEKLEALLQSLEPSRRDGMIARLENEVSIFENMLSAGESLENPARQLWRYLLTTKQVPCSDILDKINPTDTIQVYGVDHRLLFASLNFYDYVSFTLEQVFCETWHKAVRRERKVEETLYASFMRVISGEISHTIEGEPPHLVEEIDTEMLLKSDLRVKWISPAFSKENNSKLVSIISVVEISNHQEKN
jgi:hypothetical protein